MNIKDLLDENERLRTALTECLNYTKYPPSIFSDVEKAKRHELAKVIRAALEQKP